MATREEMIAKGEPRPDEVCAGCRKLIGPDEKRHNWKDGIVTCLTCGGPEEAKIEKLLHKALKDTGRLDDANECFECGSTIKDGKCPYCDKVKLQENNDSSPGGVV